MKNIKLLLTIILYLLFTKAVNAQKDINGKNTNNYNKSNHQIEYSPDKKPVLNGLQLNDKAPKKQTKILESLMLPDNKKSTFKSKVKLKSPDELFNKNNEKEKNPILKSLQLDDDTRNANNKDSITLEELYNQNIKKEKEKNPILKGLQLDDNHSTSNKTELISPEELFKNTKTSKNNKATKKNKKKKG